MSALNNEFQSTIILFLLLLLKVLVNIIKCQFIVVTSNLLRSFAGPDLPGFK